jgi:hypothetical protein
MCDLARCVFDDAHLVNYLKYRVRNLAYLMRKVRYSIFDLDRSAFEDAYLATRLAY